MGYRPGDPTVTFEAKIDFKSKASYLVTATLGGRYFVPFSQIIGWPELPEADENGNREFEVTEWWWNRKEAIPDE